MTKRKRPPWSRRAKILRNLLLALLLTAASWYIAGTPLPDLWKFRSMEQRALVPPTEIVMEIQAGESWGHGYIGFGGDIAVSAIPSADWFEIHPLEEDPHLITLSPYFTLWDPGPEFATAFVALQPPNETVSARLTLYQGNESFSIEGEKRNQVFLFLSANSNILQQEDNEPLPYELAFYDETGTLIETATHP